MLPICASCSQILVWSVLPESGGIHRRRRKEVEIGSSRVRNEETNEVEERNEAEKKRKMKEGNDDSSDFEPLLIYIN